MMLKVILVRAQREVKSIVRKASHHEHPIVHEQNLDININMIIIININLSGETLKGNEEHIIGNRRKGNFCYKEAENLAELCSFILGGK